MNEFSPPADRPPPDAPLLQFRLRHLLWAVTAVSVLLALFVTLQGQSRLVLLIGVGVVSGHVLATVIGLRLRQNANRRRRWHRERGLLDPDESTSRLPVAPPHLRMPIPPGPLGDAATRLPWLPLLVAGGAVLAGVTGGLVLATTIGDRITLPGMLVGALSAAVLGAWIAFVLGGFVGISRHAWRDASRQYHDRTGR